MFYGFKEARNKPRQRTAVQNKLILIIRFFAKMHDLMWLSMSTSSYKLLDHCLILCGLRFTGRNRLPSRIFQGTVLYTSPHQAIIRNRRFSPLDLLPYPTWNKLYAINSICVSHVALPRRELWLATSNPP